jgi:hypothetical protein
MAKKSKLSIVLGLLGALSILAFASAAAFLVYISKDIEGAAVSMRSAAGVVVGETFALDITVKNERTAGILEISDVDIADEFMDGFIISSVEPKQKSSIHLPVDNSQSFTFDASIPAGDSLAIGFILLAVKAGVYRGDVDVCEGSRFITNYAQIAVKEKN